MKYNTKQTILYNTIAHFLKLVKAAICDFFGLKKNSFSK